MDLIHDFFPVRGRLAVQWRGSAEDQVDQFSRTLDRSPSQRRKAERLGRNAEDQVEAYWVNKGFTLLARRLRTGAGELDMVVADAQMLVLIEVKARRSLIQAAYAISPQQQARLLEAASLALATHAAWERPVTRFDVALVCAGRMEHIEDAIRYQ